jgi:hypothetical protein
LLLIRLTLLTAAVVAAVVFVVLVDSWWAVALAAVVLVLATAAAVLWVLHYTSAGDWLAPSDEAQLQDAGLVDSDTGLPKRRRWSALRAGEYAEEVARRGLVAVPEGWRGPDGAHRVLLIATVPVAAEDLRRALPESVTPNELAVLVVVPTLAATAGRFRRGDASEAVEHAEAVARETVTSLRAAGIHVSGHIGPADPAVALSDGLRTYDAESVVVVRRSGGGRYLEDVPLQPAADAFGVPMAELAAKTGSGAS